MQAYSRLKRIAILAARDAGKSTSEVARKFGVSESWVRRVVQQRRELGKLGPYKFRFRDRHDTSLRRRARYLIREDPGISVTELERALHTKFDINELETIKDGLDISNRIEWYGGLACEFIVSPTGNYFSRRKQDSFPWDLEREVERLKAGEPEPEPYRLRQDNRQYPINTKEFPML